jgi:hypothetical protein
MNINKYKTAQSVKDPKVKFEEWKNILVGGDKHSIRNQIYDMIWDSAFFRCINESRKYADKDNKDERKQNRMVHYFINQSFFKTQLLSIRKLIDKDFNRVQRNKLFTVYSLYNLIEDMKINKELVTRKNILDSSNLPYDYEEATNNFKKETGYTTGPYIVPQEIASSEDIHRRIDSIVGVGADKRRPDDVVPAKLLEQFNDKLASIDDLCKYVDKFIAHATTPENRKIIPDEIEGALGKVLNAHKIICKTASYLGNNLLFCGFGSVLSIPRYGPRDQFDLFEYLDEPIASKETLMKLREFWEKYRRETEQWSMWWCK